MYPCMCWQINAFVCSDHLFFMRMREEGEHRFIDSDDLKTTMLGLAVEGREDE